ncbi:MAG: hypothetical protein Q7U38_19450, partial [Methylobacter sp.]|nr:hypothetical protein [Methylobacter sp.]
VMDLVVFCLTYLVKIFSWLLHKFFRPFFDYLRDIEFPCLECVSTLWDAIDQLLAMDFNFSLGFDVVGFLRYLMGFINFGYGMEVIFCVLLARFILRRIPFIG